MNIEQHSFIRTVRRKSSQSMSHLLFKWCYSQRELLHAAWNHIPVAVTVTVGMSSITVTATFWDLSKRRQDYFGWLDR
eukprot:3319847-Amphidinium_carterae.1